MKYEGTMIVVKDIERSKRFYQEVLGLEVVKDFGANVTLTRSEERRVGKEC